MLGFLVHLLSLLSLSLGHLLSYITLVTHTSVETAIISIHPDRFHCHLSKILLTKWKQFNVLAKIRTFKVQSAILKNVKKHIYLMLLNKLRFENSNIFIRSDSLTYCSCSLLSLSLGEKVASERAYQPTNKFHEPMLYQFINFANYLLSFVICMIALGMIQWGERKGEKKQSSGYNYRLQMKKKFPYYSSHVLKYIYIYICYFS